MGKKNRHALNTEFPLLDELNLYASTTEGDGNCLFRALSDQVFGDESRHAEIRSNVVSYVEKHGDHFAAFVGEYGETFEQYIRRLYQDGVYGGHIEIVGFAEFYGRQVVVYQADNMYILQPQNLKPSEWTGTAHLAYHTWEHYSSVRPKAGPHSGPVEFPVPEQVNSERSEETAGNNQDSAIPPWKIEIVLRSVPDASESRIIEMLRIKDLDTVIEELLVQQYEEPNEPSSEKPLDSKGNVTLSDEPEQEAEVPNHDEPVQDQQKDRSEEQATKLNKKQLAKDRRQEKKDRARRRKTGSTAQQQSSSQPSTTVDNNEQSKTTKRVIHI